jgi:redox-sensitive bicupin YhaK (pirin superfamily)
MTRVLRSEDRGRTTTGWLESRHGFSFGAYRDPRRTGYSGLRVLNEDRIAPGAGFATHGHRDMEIVTVMLEGALRHADSLGGGGATLSAGDVQAMTAGSGIEHSEANPSLHEPTHLLQIWIEPEARGLTPSYRQKSFAAARREGGKRLLTSPSGRDGSLVIHADAEISLVGARAGESVDATLPSGRRAFLQIARGTVRVGAETLEAGDAAEFDEGETIAITGVDAWSEALLFDLRA